MAKPLAALPKDARTLTTAIRRGMAQAVRVIAEAGSNTIIDNTPVLTTRAVSNWKARINKPYVRKFPPKLPGDGTKKGAETRGRAVKQIMKYQNKQVFQQYKRESQTIYISNRVPYIRLLENGGPKNRPYGMVAKGLLAMRLRANTIKIIKEGFKSKG
jgi:hypothetical protein